MALQKSKEAATGSTGEYWRVEFVVVPNGSSEKPRVGLALYKDAAARQAGKDPMEKLMLTYPAESSPVTIAACDDANPVELAYTRIKTDPFFSDAQNV